MKEKMFETIVKKPKSTLKWLFFPVSLLVHGLVIAGIVVAPLLSAADKLPEVTITDVFLKAPAPPQTPAPPKGKRAGTRDGDRRGPERREPRPSTVRDFVPPIDIPDDIPEESFEDIVAAMNMGGEGEVDGGVIGIDNGIDGPSILGTGSRNTSSPGTFQFTHVQPPRLIKRVSPNYPIAPRKARIEGVVSIEAVTDIYGRVVKVRVTSGHPLLRSAAIQAVKQWIYEPYILNGIPKPVVFTVDVNFKLER
ncbi:MAG: energy transducer TonB [Candidatus Aminicenantes bacterium]|nr:MAG: energy transducer TonB [Candidatus Aminicenantes bacterium]